MAARARGPSYQGRHRRTCAELFQASPYQPVDVCGLQSGHTGKHKGRYRSQEWAQGELFARPVPAGSVAKAKRGKVLQTDTEVHKLNEYTAPLGDATRANRAVTARIDRRRSK